MTTSRDDAGSAAGTLTDLIRLASIPSGDERELHDRLMQEAREVVRRAKRRYTGAHAIGTTDLLHHALERTILLPAAAPGQDRVWESRERFFAAVAKATVESIVDDHRRRAAQKRGGDASVVDLDARRDALARRLRESAAANALSEEDRAAVAEALRSLERLDPRAAAVVTLRFFYGLSMPEIASALDQSERTVKRDWRAARAWLFRALGPIARPDPSDLPPSRPD